MTDRAKIVARIRALLQMTVANGCTEEEAATAARLAAKLMAEHAVEETETSVEEDLYEGDRITILDPDIGERIWKPAASIADLTACRYWTSRHGTVPHHICFFGETHAVKIAKYLLAICFRAMEVGKTTVQEKFALQPRRVRPNVWSYLDGMADRLYERIRDMVPKPETGTGLVVLKFALIDERLKKAGHSLGEQRGRASRDFDSYQDGRAHADRVNLNAGITAARPERIR